MKRLKNKQRKNPTGHFDLDFIRDLLIALKSGNRRDFAEAIYYYKIGWKCKDCGLAHWLCECEGPCKECTCRYCICNYDITSKSAIRLNILIWIIENLNKEEKKYFREELDKKFNYEYYDYKSLTKIIEDLNKKDP